MKVGALMVALGGLGASLHGPPALPHPGLMLDEDGYCEAPRTQGFAEPAPGRREVACESGLRGMQLFDDGFYQQSHEALLRSLAAWDLPYGHLLMAKVEANLGRPREALEHVWLAARHGGRGLIVEELELLAQLERHLLDHELGQLGADASALAAKRVGVAINVAHLAREARRLETERAMARDCPDWVHAVSRSGRPRRAAPTSQLEVGSESRELPCEAERRASAKGEACAGLKGKDKTLCAALEEERWRFAERLRAVETRSRQLVDRRLEHTR